MVRRVGTPRRGVVEVPLADIHPLHPVPRPDKPANYVTIIAALLQANGYDVGLPVQLVRMPDGRLLQFGGHHRTAAMLSLGETTIPARVLDWASMSAGAHARWFVRFPYFPWDDFLK